MTVSELIAQLETLDPTTLVLTSDNEPNPRFYPVTLDNTILVEPLEDDSTCYCDVTYEERDKDTLAIVI